VSCSLSPPAKSLITIALALGIMAGCNAYSAADPTTATASGQAVADSVHVEFGGCKTVLWELGADSITCVYSRDSPLQLWVDHPDAELAGILIADRPIDANLRTLESESGAGFEVAIADSGVTALQVAVPDAPRWTLRMLEDASLGEDLERARAGFRHEGGKIQERLRAGDRTALESLDELLRNALSRGLLGDAVSFTPGASYFTTTVLEEPAAALQMLDALNDLTLRRFPHGHARLQIYRSQALRRLGHSLDATMAARDGSRIAMRLDDDKRLLGGLTEYSLLLAHLGYATAAARWSAEVLELGKSLDVAEPMLLLQMVAATHLLLERAGHAHADAQVYYEQIIELAKPGGESPHAATHAYSLITLASIAMLHRAPQRAMDYLDTLDETGLPTRLQAYALDVELLALVTIGASPKTLRSRLEALDALVARVTDTDMKLRATVRRAHVLENLGEDTDAEQAYQDAEQMLDLLIPLAALGIGAEGSFAQLGEGTDRYLSFLLRGPTPRITEALCVARQAHARLTRMSSLTQRLDGESRSQIFRATSRYLESKEDYEDSLHDADTLPKDELELALRRTEWMSEQLERQAHEILSGGDAHYARPSCEQLTPRRPGEVLLSLYPLGDSLLVLTSSDLGDDYHRVDLPEPDDSGSLPLTLLAPALLGPIDEQLQHAQRIRVLASGSANAIPVHALSWNEQALILQKPVVYSLELPPVDEEPDDPSMIRHAVVHSDAEAHEDGAAAAADDGARRLDEHGFEVQRFDTASAQGADIRAALAGTEHFLYAGHAYFQSSADPVSADDQWPPYPGGSESEPSYLPLDAFARLEVADILMTQPAPDVAVLIGCATGVTDERTRHGGQSLATAFLSAGSRVAVASTRPIQSEQAWILAGALYEQLPEGRIEPGRWMQHALQTARRHGLREESIAYYRVFVP